MAWWCFDGADRTHTLQVGAEATAYDVKAQLAALQGKTFTLSYYTGLLQLRDKNKKSPYTVVCAHGGLHLHLDPMNGCVPALETWCTANSCQNQPVLSIRQGGCRHGLCSCQGKVQSKYKVITHCCQTHCLENCRVRSWGAAFGVWWQAARGWWQAGGRWCQRWLHHVRPAQTAGRCQEEEEEDLHQAQEAEAQAQESQACHPELLQGNDPFSCHCCLSQSAD